MAVPGRLRVPVPQPQRGLPRAGGGNGRRGLLRFELREFVAPMCPVTQKSACPCLLVYAVSPQPSDLSPAPLPDHTHRCLIAITIALLPSPHHRAAVSATSTGLLRPVELRRGPRDRMRPGRLPEGHCMHAVRTHSATTLDLCFLLRALLV